MNRSAFLRRRKFTYAEVVGFAEYYAQHRYEDNEIGLLSAFLGLSETKASDNALKFVQAVELAVARRFNQSLEAIRSRRRYPELVACRQAIAYVACKHVSEATAAAALVYGTRNNVHDARMRATKRLTHDQDYGENMALVEADVRPFIDLLKTK
jgi:chromosomal replication initiation ATPase DnaA